MLHRVGLALLLAVGIAVPAAASDRYDGEAAAGIAHQGAAARAKTPMVHHAATSAQRTRASSGAPWFSWGTGAARIGGDVVPPTVGVAALPRERRELGGTLNMPWFGQGKPGLRLPVTERLSLAVGYRRLQGEDLWRRYAEAGSVDYDSHDFLLRAHWRF